MVARPRTRAVGHGVFLTEDSTVFENEQCAASSDLNERLPNATLRQKHCMLLSVRPRRFVNWRRTTKSGCLNILLLY